MSDNSSSRTKGVQVVLNDPNNHRARLKKICTGLLLGQVICWCLSGTAVTSTLLQDKYSVHTPTTQNFIVYVALACVYGSTIAFREERGLCTVLLQRGWKYALIALIDVEANFLIVSAFRYTNLISISVLNRFTIVIVLLLSWLCLRVRYLGSHVAGVALSLVGLACLVYLDATSTGALSGGSNRILGDVLCLLASSLYGVSNVCEEYLVKTQSRTEFLGMVGLFGSLISAAQLLILEREQLMLVDWQDGRIVLIYALYAVCLFGFYSLVTVAIQKTSATLFNLSIVATDFYNFLIGMLIFDIQFRWLYFVSVFFVIAGTVVYSLQDTQDAREVEKEMDHDEEDENNVVVDNNNHVMADGAPPPPRLMGQLLPPPPPPAANGAGELCACVTCSAEQQDDGWRDHRPAANEVLQPLNPRPPPAAVGRYGSDDVSSVHEVNCPVHGRVVVD